eukprot:4606203-Alexandrium_andersonii.AAC.1
MCAVQRHKGSPETSGSGDGTARHMCDDCLQVAGHQALVCECFGARMWPAAVPCSDRSGAGRLPELL